MSEGAADEEVAGAGDDAVADVVALVVVVPVVAPAIGTAGVVCDGVLAALAPGAVALAVGREVPLHRAEKKRAGDELAGPLEPLSLQIRG